MSVQFLDSPIGLLRLLADEAALRSITLVRQGASPAPNEVTRQAAGELREYFSGNRKSFSVTALAQGTPFQRQVWAKLQEIPYGRVVTYGQLAAAIGRPAACRAVANAVGKNPLLILLPCHRVVGSRGLGGFSAGLAAKRILLAAESIEFSEKAPFFQKYSFTF